MVRWDMENLFRVGLDVSIRDVPRPVWSKCISYDINLWKSTLLTIYQAGVVPINGSWSLGFFNFLEACFPLVVRACLGSIVGQTGFGLGKNLLIEPSAEENSSSDYSASFSQVNGLDLVYHHTILPPKKR